MDAAPSSNGGDEACPGPAFADFAACRLHRAVLEHERWALELIARDAPLQEVLQALCQALEQALPGLVCSVLGADAARGVLTGLAGPSLPPGFFDGLGAVAIAPDLSPCGTAAFRKAPVIAADMTADALWQGVAPLARAFGLRSCWSLPFFDTAGAVAGTFAVYGRQPRTPAPAELQLLQATARLAELAVRQEHTRRLLSTVEAERSLLFRTVGAGILTFDGAGRLASANPAACAVLARTEAELQGLALAQVLAGAQDAEGRPVDWQALLLAGEPQRHDLLWAVPIGGDGGAPRWLRATLSAFGAAPDGGAADAWSAAPGRSVVCSFIDVTPMQQAQSQLARRALYDDLTGLLNRAALARATAERLEDCARRGAPLAMLVMDLDGFKHVNDTLGHAAGDAVLCEVARRLSRVVRAPDVLARRSGDEFVLLVEGDEAVAARVAARVLDALRLPLRLQAQEVFIGASIGVAVCPQHGRGDAELFRHADAAMYRAKRGGRHRFVLHQPQPQAPGAAGPGNRLLLEAQLRYALERRELVLHYQPRVWAESGRVCGVEALVRWQHPELGLLAPGAFIPLAEETGLIVPLGEWVLFEACTRMAHWHALGHRELRVSVNVAALQFSPEFFAQTVPAALALSGLEPRALELEVSESTVMSSLDQATLDAMHALRARGVRVLLDDFGTGYSSLSVLHRFSLDGLKVDLSFVSRLPQAPDARAIARAIIGMAKALKLQLTAEGVERTEQRDWLASHGCDEMQGFLWARPLPPPALERLLAAERRAPAPPLPACAIAPLPDDEAQRLQTIEEAGLRRLGRQPTLEALVQTVSHLLDLPIAMVAIVDAERVWLHAAVGSDDASLPRERAFCAHALLEDDLLVVEDARRDARFAGHPLVTGAAGWRFYAGVPLRVRDAQGVPRKVGALCAIDREPRRLKAAQRLMLAELAQVASRALEQVRPADVDTAPADAAVFQGEGI